MFEYYLIIKTIDPAICLNLFPKVLLIVGSKLIQVGALLFPTLKFFLFAIHLFMQTNEAFCVCVTTATLSTFFSSVC